MWVLTCESICPWDTLAFPSPANTCESCTGVVGFAQRADSPAPSASPRVVKWQKGLWRRGDTDSPFSIWPEPSPPPKSCSMCMHERLYMLACVCAVSRVGEIMSTKGAPGALDWVSLLPFLPLSSFHPPLPCSSGHLHHYPGTFKRLGCSFIIAPLMHVNCLEMRETNGDFFIRQTTSWIYVEHTLDVLAASHV